MSEDTLKRHGTRSYQVACAVLFLVFTFCYLYFYQDNLLAMGQYVLSKGRTHYNHMVGAVLLTLFLWLLQIGCNLLFRLKGRSHALTYVPSVVCLTAITSIGSDIVQGVTLGWWWIVAPLLITIALVAMCYARRSQTYEPLEHNWQGLLGRWAWVNYGGLLVQFFFVALCSNHNQVLHTRLEIEQYVMDGTYRQTLKVGAHSLHTDSTLTCLRIYSLSLAGLLPERLFEYPLVGNSVAMLPDNPGVNFLMCGKDKFYQHLGAWFRQPMHTMHYLRFIHRHGLATPAAHDYLLCAYLLDGNLEAFVRTIGKYYDLKRPLPKHYREALVLYNHLRSTPYVVYHDSVMDADFTDFQSLARQYGRPRQRLSALRDTYGNTYWTYYYRLRH